MKLMRKAIATTFLVLSFMVLVYCEYEDEGLYDIELKEAWITMPDGVKLAADLYVPKTKSGREKFPVLLEYIPYRKDEHRKLRYSVFSYFVKRGYIVARVDIRGTGKSEGELVAYEYSEQEKQDGEMVIDWLSKQDFSTGNIGMFGISWGGFNSIQLAMRKPPALKAILAMMATDDIYEDDVHFMDGMMHVDAYEIGRDLKNVIPGAPDFNIDGDYFAEKFDTEPWLLKYKRQQRDGDFWDKGSLNSDYSALQTPIFMISGWYDGYRDSTPKILQQVTAPKKAIVGPWNHTFPHMSSPPPSIEWREEAVKWFDYWLKGVDNGIMEEPQMAAFIRDGHGPGVPDEILGHWKAVAQWPPADQKKKTWFLQEQQKLSDKQDSVIAFNSLSYKASSGIEASGSVMWWGDWSPDIKPSEEHSLVYETEPLTEDITILGFPKLHFNVAVSQGQAHFISRLSNVSPENEVTLITGAGLNGSHRNSSKHPERLIPNKLHPLDIEMHFTSWTFKKGHRIRVSLSNGQWPMIWPNPSKLDLKLQLGGNNPSALTLPVIDAIASDEITFSQTVKDPKLEGYQTMQSGTVSGFAEVSEATYDPETGIAQVIANNSNTTSYPWAIWSTKEHIVHQANDLSPEFASVKSDYQIHIKTKQKDLTWYGILDFNSDAQNFYYTYTRKLMAQDSLIRSKTWKETIARDFQ